MKVLKVIIAMIICAVILSGTVAAEIYYHTYTYTSAGRVESTPEAYSYSRIYTGADFGTDELKNPGYLFMDDVGNLYIADTGNIMPPKTTWFEPKLRSGIVIHAFDE